MESHQLWLGHLEKQLQDGFKKGQWTEVSSALESLCQTARHLERNRLEQKALSLKEVMGIRGGGRMTAGARVGELFHELICEISSSRFGTH